MRLLLVVSLCIAAVLADGPAGPCDTSKCKIENNCRCSTTVAPLNVSDVPQLVSLTFNEAIVQKYFDKVWIPLLGGRKNADGSLAAGTFFVPHEYTDYVLVQQLYNMGHEIGVHSVTKNHSQEYWRTSSYDTLYAEFSEQREIIHYFAKIPINRIKGTRAPQLQFNGNVTFHAFVDANLTYDNSWPTRPEIRLFPYTLDYLSTEECEATRVCPVESFPGFWVNPIIDITGKDGKICHEIFGCEISGDKNAIAQWLLDHVEKSRSTNKAPVTLLADASWFDNVPNSLDGMKLFLDTLGGMKDVFLVSQNDIVRYMQDPKPISEYKPTARPNHLNCITKECVNLSKPGGEKRNLRACVPCPSSYPWLGNPHGN